MSKKNDSNSKDALTYREKCSSLLEISEKVRYVGILNRFGRTLAGKLRQDIKPLLTPTQARDEHFVEAVRQQSRNSFDSSLGKTLFTITKNELVTLVLIPSEDQQLMYYLTIDKEVQMQEVMTIINQVKRQRNVN